MAELPEHSHCRFCGDPIGFGKEYCSEECADHFAKRKRRNSIRENGFFLLAIVAVIVISVVIYAVR